MLLLKNVGFERAGQTILEGLSFDVPEAALTTIIGPNGAGKTTLLNILAGLLVPTQGSITRPQGKKIGYMPQTLVTSSFLPLTVETFLELTPSGPKRGRDVFASYGWDDSLTQKYMHALSAGEKQRVLFVKALMQQPDILILDEPTQGLDIEGETQFYKALRALLTQQSLTVIMASHDLHTVFRESAHIVCVNKTLCCSGPPEDVQAHDHYQQLFKKQIFSQLRPYVHPHN